MPSTFDTRCQNAKCRSCGKAGLAPVLDLGLMPLSDGLLTKDQLTKPEGKYPLDVGFCPSCTLVQILETVPPEVLFGHDYPYFSSFSEHLLKHSRDNALSLIAARKLGPRSLVVELASNDGYLLKNFVEKGVPVLGIDPAPGPAKAAEKVGVPTMNTFFTKDLATQLVKEGKRADVIIGNNVLAHVADTNGFVQGVAMLLKDDPGGGGTTSIEVPYLRDLIDHCEFDTIYHEHLCYFSVMAVDALFRRNGLFLNHVERLPIHGGSLRLFAGRREQVQDSVKKLIAEEKSLGMDKPAYYKSFGDRVRQIGDTLRSMLQGFKQQGKKIAAYGAAAKGAIMVNYALGGGGGTDLIEFVVDKNTHKQGKYMPGVHIPILAPEEIMKRKPDYVVLLPWNFKDEILRQQDEYRRGGGKFVIPIPSPVVV